MELIPLFITYKGWDTIIKQYMSIISVHEELFFKSNYVFKKLHL